MLVGNVAAALCCGEPTAMGAIDRARREHVIIAARRGYQPVGAAVMENVVTGYLRELLTGAPGPERNLFSENPSAIITQSIERYSSNTGLQLNAAQRRAVEMAMYHPLRVFSGGAGPARQRYSGRSMMSRSGSESPFCKWLPAGARPNGGWSQGWSHPSGQ
jgi:hypothetical protein